MKIYRLGGAISLYIDTSELATLGLSPDSLTCRDAMALLDSADPAEKWNRAALELYPGRDGVMLFARRTAGMVYYGFRDFEALLLAAKLCPTGLPSCLFHLAGQYILGIAPWLGDSSPQSLGEFGDRLEMPEFFPAHMDEQGFTLIRCFAADKLSENFS